MCSIETHILSYKPAADDSADESNIASSQTGGAMNDAAMAGVGNIAGILAAAALPLSHI